MVRHVQITQNSMSCMRETERDTQRQRQTDRETDRERAEVQG